MVRGSRRRGEAPEGASLREPAARRWGRRAGTSAEVGVARAVGGAETPNGLSGRSYSPERRGGASRGGASRGRGLTGAGRGGPELRVAGPQRSPQLRGVKLLGRRGVVGTLGERCGHPRGLENSRGGPTIGSRRGGRAILRGGRCGVVGGGGAESGAGSVGLWEAGGQ